MGLRSQFAANRDLEREGLWFDIKAAMNKDGTIPGFKMARMSVNNPAYQAAMERLYKEHGTAIENDTLANAAARPLLLDIFANTILLDWRNVQPNDDGVNVSHTPANVVSLLDEMPDLYEVLAKYAKQISHFQRKELDDAAKKSQPPSSQRSGQTED